MHIWTDRRVDVDLVDRMESVADVVVEQGGGTTGLPGAGAVLIGSRTADGAFMDTAGESLLVIARAGIGIDNVDVPQATARGIVVVNTPDAPTESTAQHAVALLLALSKRVVPAHNMLTGGEVNKPLLLGTELRGRVAGIIGFGRIGQRVAAMLKNGFDMRLLVYDPYVDPGVVEAAGAQPVTALPELLGRADCVMVHPALTPETSGLIGEAELRMMKRDAYLVNTSRGPVVDERALYRVMSEGVLSGAGLDVFDPEPPRPDNPLFAIGRVIATPHIGSYTPTGVRSMDEGAVNQILDVLAGRRPVHLVNPEAWPDRGGETTYA